MGERLFPFFQTIRTAWQVLVVLSLIRMVSNCLDQAYVLYQKRECGLWLFGSFFSLAILLSRAPVVFVKKIAESDASDRIWLNHADDPLLLALVRILQRMATLLHVFTRRRSWQWECKPATLTLSWPKANFGIRQISLPNMQSLYDIFRRRIVDR